MQSKALNMYNFSYPSYLKATGDAVDMIREAQKRGVRVTAETCHHYLNLSAKEVPQGATQFKCCPPIREEQTTEIEKDQS